MTQVFHYYTSPAAPIYFPGAAFALAAFVCTISLIPLMRGLKIAPKLEEQPPDPVGEIPPEDAPARHAGCSDGLT
jgi:DHA1 family tetracycline resistance protein-like MFS transporter